MPVSSALTPASPVHALKGVGDAKNKALARLEIRTLADLIKHLPVRYEDHIGLVRIRDLVKGTEAALVGTVAKTRWMAAGGFGKKGRFEVVLEDDSGTLNLSFFNAKWMQEQVRPGDRLWVQGKAGSFNGYPQLVGPKYKKLEKEDSPLPASGAARQRPVYPATEGLAPEVIEKLVGQALDALAGKLTDPVPASLLEHHAMPALENAFRMAHQPADADEAKAARRRLAWNELLLLQLGIAMKRAFVKRAQVAPALPLTAQADAQIRARFPFALTGAQERVIAEISADLQLDSPMNRLVQGDVGSGKTVVALFACLAAARHGKQALVMAPTQVLAEQHFASMSRMLEGTPVRLALLSGGTTASGSKARKALLAQMVAGEVDLVIGTQALVGDEVVFKDLAVAVIDEQHRFGVHQRASFRARPEAAVDGDGRKFTPHHLVMTATPIPRTLAVTLFGDLDVSTIDQLPPGRTPVVTKCVPPSMGPQVYVHVKERLARGERVFVVVPAVEDAQDLGLDAAEGAAPRVELKSVATHAKELAAGPLAGFEIATMHGQMPRPEREEAMRRFRSGEAQVLVATTVIEVGVDVPEATVMVVEHAERFGLSQLHQLRGRVGRGQTGATPLCILVADTLTEESEARMEVMVATGDGFKIAEKDFELRGMGEVMGTKQHGAAGLKVAEFPRDLELLNLARKDAAAIIEQDPPLAKPQWKMLRAILMRAHGASLGLADVG